MSCLCTIKPYQELLPYAQHSKIGWRLLQIVYNPDTGKSKGFGFVKFEDSRDADDAIAEANGKVSSACA